jgi:hypothetical protein
MVAGAGFGSDPALAAKPRPAPVAAPVAPTPSRQVIMVPARPTPPLGVTDSFIVPTLSATGERQTINVGITPMQTTWNFRSAYNVAALNCRDTKYDPVLTGYRAFIRTHAVGLRRANAGVDANFRARYGARFVAPREAYMTQVYNFYSFPATLDKFCEAALLMSVDAAKVTRVGMPAFAAAQLPKLDLVFEDFYRSFEQYRIDVAAWDAQYAKYFQPAPPVVQPGPRP